MPSPLPPPYFSRHGGMPRLRAGAQHLRDEDAGGVPGEGMWGRAVDRDYSEGLPPAPPPGEKETVREASSNLPSTRKTGGGVWGSVDRDYSETSPCPSPPRGPPRARG